ncbi:MAG: hypothetical protein LBK67_05905, partial [Coriobacteriales bacterium]|nr:hypothetical protein [Coriobacteriales bacterium]
RSTEGTGLGLSIAQSLTELQTGQLELAVDGDLFKAILRFRAISLGCGANFVANERGRGCRTGGRGKWDKGGRGKCLICPAQLHPLR